MIKIEKSKNGDGDIYKNGSGEIIFWVDSDASFMIKTKTAAGDPVELAIEEAIELAEAILKLAKENE